MYKRKVKLKLISIIIIVFLICPGLILNFYPISIHSRALASSTWIEATNENFENGTLDNVTIFGNGSEAEIRLNLSTSWTKKNPQNNLGKRFHHAMATIYGTDKILLFGGEDGNYKNDTWVYDFSDNNWVMKSPPIKPKSRIYHAMSTIYGTNQILLFGGFYGSFTQDNDTWIYNFINDNWTQIKPKVCPNVRCSHALAPIYGTTKIVLFGGRYNVGLNFYYLNDTWVFDLSTNNWTKKHPKNSPSARYNHAMTSIYGDDKVVLYGGAYGTNETWVYDLSDDNWTRKRPKINPGDRNNHAVDFIYGTDKVMLFGGHWSSDETWIYDLSDNIWFEKFPDTHPTARTGHAMVNIYSTDKILLFGGWSSGLVGDTWIFNFTQYIKNGYFITKPYDTCSNSSFKTLSWNDDTSINTSIRIQLRTASNVSNLLNTTFVGPDGTQFTYYELSPSNIWLGHPGDQWIQLKAYLATNNDDNDTPILYDMTILYNCLPITEITNPVDRSAISNNKPTFSWNMSDIDSDHQSAFQVIIDDDINFSSIDYNSSEQISKNEYWQFPDGTSYSKMADGIWYWKVRTKDNDGDWGYYSSPFSLIIDSTEPNSTVISPIDSKFYNSLKIISGKASDPMDGMGVEKVEIVIKLLNENQYWNGNDWTSMEFWLTATGTTDWTYDSSNVLWISGVKYQILSRAIDKLNNIELPTDGIGFYFDNIEPSSIVITPINDSWIKNLETISGNAEDKGGAGIEKVEISIEREGDRKYWDGTYWKFGEAWLTTKGINEWSYDIDSNIPWLYDTSYIIRSRAIDNIGNIEIPSIETIFKFDLISPYLSIIINNNDKYTNSTEVILSLQAEDSESGISQMTFSTDEITWSTWESFNNTKTFILPNGDGEKIVYLKVKDKLENFAIESDKIILDTTPPYSLSISINNGATETNSSLVQLKLNAVDEISGLYQMSFSNDGKSWSNWEEFSEIKSYSLLPGDGNNTIYFRVKDRMENIANPVQAKITKITDSDDDGILDIDDKDDDNDNFLDLWEEFLGTDPKDPNRMPKDTDDDKDPDGDENNSQVWMDLDDDNDGVSDLDELSLGTDPLLKDTDGDNYDDQVDYYPLNPSKWEKEKHPQNNFWLIIASIIIIIFFIIILIFIFVIKPKKYKKDEEIEIEEEKNKSNLIQNKQQINSSLSEKPRNFQQPTQQILQNQFSTQNQLSNFQTQPQIQTSHIPQVDQNYCSTCGQLLSYITQSNRYYCYNCRKYE